eukprot:TRINITY_DN5967_c0_g1_i2.p1 TRINITY_DN5967_c0_g1~~TRINITY_DN5967_c0_g1_i2.p1  ORF type:complete len:1690 (-),score=292.49 TRINITY_DN5967_c0_g1_i2:441-5483(-)
MPLAGNAVPSWLLLSVFSALASFAAAASKGTFDVRAKLVSGWPRTPSAAQSLEFIRDIDDAQAGEWLLELASKQTSVDELAPAKTLLISSSAATYQELLVRNSYYSPRIECLRSLERTDRQLYGKSCPAGTAWALVWQSSSASPLAVCDAATLAKVFKEHSAGGKSPAGFVGSQLDLRLQQGAGTNIVIVYGAMSTSGFPSLSTFLREVAVLQKPSPWEVIFRHADGFAGSEGLGEDLLTGYGFELAIKSSEYKTHAEEKKEEATSEGEANRRSSNTGSDGSTEGDLELKQASVQELEGQLEIDGLLFHVLLNRHPTVRARVWAFKEQLEVERDTDQILKAWEIKDIGLQATAKIKASPNPLLALMQLSQNFPSHVVGLSRSSIPDALRTQSDQLRRIMRHGTEVFSLNGRLVRPDHSDLSLFPLMQTLHPFFLGVERLARIGVSEAVACDILKEIKGSGQGASRLDWRSPHLAMPIYAVLKDKETQRWGANLRSLLFGFPGGLSPVRLPLYKIIFVFDPAEVEDLNFAASLLGQMPLPANLHLVMLPPTSGTGNIQWNEDVLGEQPSWLAAPASKGSPGGSTASTAIAAAFGHALAKGRRRGQEFVNGLVKWMQERSQAPSRWQDTKEYVEGIKSVWAAVMHKGTAGDMDQLWEEVLENASKPGSYLENATSYAASLGTPVPCMLVNGKLMMKGAYDGQHALLQSVAEDQQRLQQAVYTGQLQEDGDAEAYFLSGGVLSAYHPDIAPDMAERGGEAGMKTQSKSADYDLWPSDFFLKLPFLDSLEMVGVETNAVHGGEIRFFHVVVLRRLCQTYLLQTFASHLLSPGRKAGEGPALSSHWAVLVDGSKGETGLVELGNCVRGLMRLEAEAGADNDEKRNVNRQKLAALKFIGLALPAALSAKPDLSSSRVQDLCRLAIDKKIEVSLKPRAQTLVADAVSATGYEAHLLAHATRMRKGDWSRTGQEALWVCNGRRIYLEDGGQPISARHVLALELMEAQYDFAEPASAEDDEQQEPAQEHAESKALSDWLAGDAGKGATLPISAYGLVAAIRSAVLSHGKNERFTQPAKIFDMVPSAFRLHLPPALPQVASPITIYGILDPLSEVSQSASAALALFGMVFNAEVKLVLNPPMRVTEYPLKRYYREVVHWPERLADGRTLAELEDGASVGSGRAEMTLATQHTLTAAVHALPTWLVASREAIHDMDNLRAKDIGQGKACETTYVLRQLYVEGQALVLGDEGWPIATAKGVQFEITGKGALQASDDTIVMGNLGYFQVKGDPGLYKASLKSGPSNDTFELATVQDLEVSSYITPPHQLRVLLREGKAHDDLFGPEGSHRKKNKGAAGGLFGALKSMLGGEDAVTDREPEAPVPQMEVSSLSSGHETIHIFSVASGHLYEKLLGIMILSVRNNTQNPLHFWFIDQFLSPHFKAFIPKLSERYNFKYDFVTYKWPSWLNPQSEKQRLIWAYKILFLDVLFPQGVPKIIFIDADQVVRADVRELWDIDLKGNVYGFTPMGDTNPATEGFRFWKQGYWKGHLGEKPYHISALFVVDLKELRRTSTGETLRGVYNQLSRDPNSLANLDQDLPNFAQHQVPIYSLPPEWLWCETWCSQETKAAAKTIDLCQNPLTKEPKIVMARRIISEWQSYHDEVEHFRVEAGLAVMEPSNSLASKPEQSMGKPEL